MQLKISHLYRAWQGLKKWPFGSAVFNYIICFINPYTGALKANVVEFHKGYARLELKDRRAIRNHLNSIHAIALTNLGEFASGLALVSLFSEDMRGIPVDIHIRFLKKARGKLIAECKTQLPVFSEETEHLVKAEIRNMDNERVSVVEVKWKLSYRQQDE